MLKHRFLSALFVISIGRQFDHGFARGGVCHSQ